MSFWRRKPRYAPCAGCGAQPLLTYADPPANQTAHITCVNSECPAPRWTSTIIRPRTKEEAIAEWARLNQADRAGRT